MKKSTGTAILTVMAVGVAGAAAFLFTRPAAAKSLAAKAFNVDPNCGFFLVTDEEKAKSAIIAASIAVAPSPDSNALAALKAILAFMFKQCDWENPPDSRTFASGPNYIDWGTIKLVVGDKTVLQLRELIDATGGMQASAPLPWLVPMVFGTGGCLSCAMGLPGTGAVVSPGGAPTGWLPATFFDYPPGHGTRRWYQLERLGTAEDGAYAATLHRKGKPSVRVQRVVVKGQGSSLKARVALSGTGARGPRMNLTLGVGGSGYLPPKIPKGWLPVKSRSYDPKARGFRRWIEPLDAPTPQNNVVRAILVMRAGAVEHNVHAELINTGGNKWKGRVTAGPF